MPLSQECPFLPPPASQSGLSHPDPSTPCRLHYALLSPFQPETFSWPYFPLKENVWWREGLAVQDVPTLPHSQYGLSVSLAGGIDPLVRGLLAKKSKLMNQNKMMTGELRNKLFQPTHKIHGFDLAAINIQRSRDHGMPGGPGVWPGLGPRVPGGLSSITYNPEGLINSSKSFFFFEDWP